MSLETFTDAYIETLLWSETNDDCEPLDEEYTADDITEESMESVKSDCHRFYDKFNDTWQDKYLRSNEYSDDEYAGYDFLLTRNGHGAGFWDGDWEEPIATQLTERSKEFGETNLLVGDDGKLYVYP